jgi:hypothetical protein
MADMGMAEQVAACFENATQIVDLRRSDPTDRAAEMIEWLCSEGWRTLVELVRSQQWDTLQEALERLNSEELCCACRWAAIELARLEP